MNKLKSLLYSKANEDIEILKNIPLFSGLRQSSLLKIAPCIKIRDFQKGGIVFAEGDLAKVIYIVKKGIFIVLSIGS